MSNTIAKSILYIELSRSSILILVCVSLFALLSARLFQMQIIEHEKYKILAKNNSTKASIIRAPRGIIYDRDGAILATSKLALKIIAYPRILAKVKDRKQLAIRLASLTGKDSGEILKKITEINSRLPLPITLANDVKVNKALQIFENTHLLPGIDVESQPQRYYPYDAIPAHILGYVGEVNEAELKNNIRAKKKLKLRNQIGKSALEKYYDQTLRGIDGEKRIFVDRYGKSFAKRTNQKELYNDAEKGSDIHLTIDIDLQKVAYDALGDVHGAAVVINSTNGEILALVSKPSYNPNLFAQGIPYSIYQELNKKKAFLNRAASGFTPGSIWKPITALTALERKIISPDKQLFVSGAINFGGFRFGDWTGKEDFINIKEALAWSRNTYFYQIAKKMKPEWLAESGRSFGLGSKTNIEINNESSGIVPDPNWKKKHMGEPWFPGNTLHLSIGQSYLMVTPLQAARMIAGIANKGKIPQLHIIKDKTKEKFDYENKDFSDSNYDIVHEGLRRCVKSGTGAAVNLKGPYKKVEIAGKTGSAEVSGYSHSTHAWFISFAPFDNPEIAVVVFGEGAGHGGSICAPVAREIYQKYFEKYHPEIAELPLL